MLCTAEDWALTRDYQPYAMDNAKLTANTLYNTNNGVKNTFDFANAPQESNIYTTVVKTATSLTVTANNPSEGSSSVVYSGKNYPAGDYIFSCKISNYSCTSETAKIYIATSTTAGTGVANKLITGNGTIQIPFHWNGGKVYIKYFPNESNTLNQSNTFTAGENMIMLASISDTTYQPYALSNAELTDNVSWNTNHGVKNLCKPNVSADSEITYTVNADNSITVTCNTTAIRDVHIFTDLSELTDGKDYILSGCSGGDYNNTYGFAVRTSSSAGKAFESDGETTFTKTVEMVKMDLIIRSGQNWTKTFYPMIRPAETKDPKYQPYALPNTTLTSGLNSYIENGVRNFAKYNHNMPSWSGVTINVSDDAISVSGTSSSSYTGFICSGLNLLVKEPFVVRIIGTYSGFSIIAQILNASGTRLYWDLSLDRTIPSGYTIEGVYMQRQSATSSVVSGNFNVLITPKAVYDLGVKDYEPYALSNAELTAQSQKVISTSGNTSKLRLTLDTTVMSNANRGSLLLSIPFQTSSYDNALLLIAIGNDSFLGVQRLDNSNNSMVTSWTLSENNTILDITLRAQPWSAPVAFPMAQVVPPITYSWES